LLSVGAVAVHKMKFDDVMELLRYGTGKVGLQALMLEVDGLTSCQ
jgi:hypothetical protein